VPIEHATVEIGHAGRMNIPVRLASIAAAAWALSAAPDAGATWTEPIEVSVAGITTGEPQVGVDGAGNTTVAWISYGGPGTSSSIRSASKPAGESWEPPLTVIGGFACHDPQLAVNLAGAAVVVADCDEGAATMRAARRDPAGTWTGSTAVPGSAPGEEPRVGLDDAGNAIVVWEGGTTVQSAYRPAAGTWAGPTQVSLAGDVTFDPQVAMGPTGAALVVWRRDGTDPVVTVQSRLRHSGAAGWTTVTDRSPLPTSTGPVVSYEPQVRWSRGGDDRLVVWDNHAVGALPLLQKTAGSGGEYGGWTNGVSPWQSAGDGATTVEAPQVALDDAGGAVAVWRSFDGAGFRIKASTTPTLFGSWSTPVPLADVETGLAEPQVGADPAGDAAAVWRTSSGTISAATRPAGGIFDPATTISSDGTTGLHPRVAMTAAGDAIATWTGSTTARVAVAVNDATPPVLSAVTVPPGVEAGTAASMSAAAADSWSPVTLVWDLGDGMTIAGDAVSHAYAAAGTRSVTVTATDAAGNAAFETRQIVVSPVPAGQDPGGPGPGGGGTPVITAVTLGVTVPRQSWRAIRKRGAVRLRCTLDGAGTCAAEATISRRLAKRLRLRIGPRAKARRVGRGTVGIERGDYATRLDVPLGRKVRRAIGRTRRRVVFRLVVTGSAPGRAPATLTKAMTVRRRP
jgi:hypothetical protein